MGETKTIPIEKETVVERIAGRIEIEPEVINLPGGDALCHPAMSLTLITADQPKGAGKFVMLISTSIFGGHRLGVLNPMTAAEARSFGASLIASADEIDPERKFN